MGNTGRSFLATWPAWILLPVLALAGGCSSPEMKGTPFYEGEYSISQGPAENRVNLWPLMYYHEPALSVLWPLGESTDEHFALRPLFSEYKLDKPHHEYNVLWPLIQFDFDERDYRIFPFFWGDAGGNGYFHVFPLAWNKSGSYSSVFPLYIWDADSSSISLLWPIFNLRQRNPKGWRVWPLYGDYEQYRFALWPLYHEIRDGDNLLRIAAPVYAGWHGKDEGWDVALPFFFRSYSPGSSLWLTPLAGHNSDAEGECWIFSPLLSAYTRTDRERGLWFLAPLTHFRWGDEGRTSHVIPLYYYDGRDNESLFLSLPVSWNRSASSGFLAVAGPLFVHRWTTSESNWNLAWPFTGAYRNSDGTKGGWVFPFIYSHSTDGWSLFAPWPLIHSEKDSRSSDAWVWPLWHYKSEPEWGRTKEKPDSKDKPEIIGRKTEFSIVGWLYDENHRYALKPDSEPVEEYARARILWRVMHYEREGGRSTLDVFPFITYDRKRETGYCKFSFAWRLFRYEREESGGLNMDVLFIPVKRP